MMDMTQDFFAGLIIGIAVTSSAWALALHIWSTRRRRPGPSNQQQHQAGDEQ